jgi:hypothetical protein
MSILYYAIIFSDFATLVGDGQDSGKENTPLEDVKGEETKAKLERREIRIGE